MLKNITLKIDDQLLTRVRHLAIDENTSVSAWVAALIERTLNEADVYEQTRREAIDALQAGLHLGGRPLSREEAHDRG
jgi:predicted transcriptional regulator